MSGYFNSARRRIAVLRFLIVIVLFAVKIWLVEDVPTMRSSFPMDFADKFVLYAMVQASFPPFPAIRHQYNPEFWRTYACGSTAL